MPRALVPITFVRWHSTHRTVCGSEPSTISISTTKVPTPSAPIRASPVKSGSLSQQSVRSIFMDSQGGMWLGTYFGGLNYYHPLKNRFQNIKRIPYQNSLNDNGSELYCRRQASQPLDRYQRWRSQSLQPHHQALYLLHPARWQVGRHPFQ